MKKIVLVLMIIGLFLAVSGCTDSAPEPVATPAPVSETKTPVPTQPPATVAATPQPTLTPGEYTITITRQGFEPSTITVKKGSTIRWLNVDSTEDQARYNPTHRIKIPNVYTGQTIAPGTSWSWAFTKSGTFDYNDMMHENLRGTIIVEY